MNGIEPRVKVLMILPEKEKRGTVQKCLGGGTWIVLADDGIRHVVHESKMTMIGVPPGIPGIIVK